MKRFFSTLPLLALLLALLPSPLLADEDPATSSPQAQSAEEIQVTVSVRHKDAVVYSGQVSLIKGSSASIADSSGASRSFPSDSALSALLAGDAASADFSVSPLPYYESFDSFYIECIALASLSKTACGNWQYVINDSYPSIGTNSYILNDGDSVYFYFGTPRKVVIAESALASVPFAIKALSYDYKNDAWLPLSGATVGVTRPNPDDPYNPIVVASGTSDADGAVTLLLDAIGTYGVGLAMDYYSLLEPLAVSSPPPAPQESAAVEIREEPERPGGSGSSSGRNESAPAIAAETIIEEPSSEILIRLDISIDVFIARYKEFSRQA